MQKRWYRLLPIMMMTFIIAFMDRTNIGFAIPTMGAELALSASVLGFASGVLFVGYAIAQSAGGWIADKGYGKVTVAVMMVLWGIAEISQGFVMNATELTIVRFFIGLFEGAVFPTFLLFVRNWFAPSERARANGIWQLCYPLAALVSGPIAGYILERGDWRQLFVIEGIFPLVWLLVWIWGAAETPARAKWLSADDRAALQGKIDRENAALDSQPAAPGAESQVAHTLGAQMRRLPVMAFTLAATLWNVGFLGFVIWLPSVLKQQPGLSPVAVGWLSAIPYALAMLVMQFLTRQSDRTLNRRFYSAVPLGISGLALLAGGLGTGHMSFLGSMVLLCVAGATLYGSQPVLWSLAVDLVPREVVGAVTGTISGISVTGAFLGPYIVGYVRTLTGSFASGLIVMGLCLVMTALLIWTATQTGRARLPARPTLRA